MRKSPPGTAGSQPDKELELFFQGAPSPNIQGLSFPGFYVFKKTQIHTPQEKSIQSAHRAGNSEINLSKGAGLNLQYEEIIFEFYSSVPMILPPPP